MVVFVTGATGVIGRRLVPLLLAGGHRVTALARTAEQQAALARIGASWSAASLFDPPALGSDLRGHDTVINLATHIPVGTRAFLPGAWRENDRIRREGSANLSAAARAAGAGRFVQESFAPIYADRGDEWIDEGSPVEAARYNRATLDAELAAAAFTGAGRVGIVLRFAYFYGPDSGFTLDTIAYARKGWAATFGRPEGFIPSVSHDDAAGAVLAALGAPAGTYNVVDDEPMRRREYFDTLACALGVAPPRLPPAWVTRLAGSLGETVARSQRISNRKLRETTGWSPRYRSMREGWRSVVDLHR